MTVDPFGRGGEHGLRRLLIQQRPCSAQERRIEALGEAVIDWRQNLPHLVGATLSYAQPGRLTTVHSSQNKAPWPRAISFASPVSGR